MSKLGYREESATVYEHCSRPSEREINSNSRVSVLKAVPVETVFGLKGFEAVQTLEALDIHVESLDVQFQLVGVGERLVTAGKGTGLHILIQVL